MLTLWYTLSWNLPINVTAQRFLALCQEISAEILTWGGGGFRLRLVFMVAEVNFVLRIRHVMKIPWGGGGYSCRSAPSAIRDLR